MLVQEVPDNEVITSAKIFRADRPTAYQQRINEEAGKLALKNPGLLTKRGELLDLARQEVVDQGYNFKKGKSRSKRFSSDVEGEGAPKPTRRKVSKEIRQQTIVGLREQIADLDKQVSYKEKRRDQAEGSRDYKICDAIMTEINELKAQRRDISVQLKAFESKEKQAAWYLRKKQEKKKASHKASVSSEMTSDDSDVPASSPSSSVRSLSFSRSPTPFHSQVSPTSTSPFQSPPPLQQQRSNSVGCIEGQSRLRFPPALLQQRLDPLFGCSDDHSPLVEGHSPLQSPPALLQQRADPTVGHSDGQSSSLQPPPVLLQQQADPTVGRSDGQSSLQPPPVLLQQRVDPTVGRSDGQSSLQPPPVLLQQRADPTVGRSDGQSSLQPPPVLLQQRADPTVGRSDGQSSLQPPPVLLQQRADPTVGRSDGQSSLQPPPVLQQQQQADPTVGRSDTVCSPLSPVFR